MAFISIFTIANCNMSSIFIFSYITTFFCFHDLNFIVISQIIKVTTVAMPVICWLVPVKVSVAITNPTRVQRRFKVSLKAITK
jgi:hypothetical protein